MEGRGNTQREEGGGLNITTSGLQTAEQNGTRLMSPGEERILVLSGGGSTQPCQSLANWAWWCIPTTLALRKPKQEDGEVKASLDHTGTLSKEKQEQQKENGKPVAL